MTKIFSQPAPFLLPPKSGEGAVGFFPYHIEKSFAQPMGPVATRNLLGHSVIARHEAISSTFQGDFSLRFEMTKMGCFEMTKMGCFEMTKSMIFQRKNLPCPS